MSEPRPLRILHLTAGSDAGGLSRYIYDLGAAMIARGHEVAVAGERGAWHWLFEPGPMPWIEVPLKGSPRQLWDGSQTLARWLDGRPVDVLHTHYRRATLAARRLQQDFAAPVLYTVHLSDLSLAWPRRLLTDFGDHTHVASEEARRWVVEAGRVPAGQVTVVPHGLDASKFPLADEETRRVARHALGLPLSARVAAFVGRLDDPKNESWLLDVAARMPGLHVVLAGEGPHEPALRKRIHADRLNGRVRLLGHRDPLPVYEAADALLLPSTREGFSLVCAEAMAVGTPPLRTRTAGTGELIIEDVTGRSTPIEHETFVAAAVEFLSMPTEALRKMGVAAAQHVRAHFTFERQLEQTLALYRRLAAARTGRGSR